MEIANELHVLDGAPSVTDFDALPRARAPRARGAALRRFDGTGDTPREARRAVLLGRHDWGDLVGGLLTAACARGREDV